MDKIIIFGNSNSSELAKQTNANLIEVPDIYVNNYGVVNDFVISKLSQDFDVLIIDADNIQRQDVALALGMFMRLSIIELGSKALAPIIIISDKRIKSFMHFKNYSQLLLTSNVYFQPRTNINIEAVTPLDAKEYKNDFLDFINILSGPYAGRHSIANQWGASVLDRLINNGIQSDNETLRSAAKSLYFKYVYAQSIDVSDFLIGKQGIKYLTNNRPPINAKGKRILLIDDEADKGWEYVLKKLIVTRDEDFNVIGHKVKDYDEFSNAEKDIIEKGNYDLIFLDLRMNGIEEEDTYKPEDFSGMKILKRIKKECPGIQTIMLTASNKAWNLKAILKEGANGYYIKESPEYKFSLGFSLANYDALRNEIKECLHCSFLRKVASKIENIRKNLLRINTNTNFNNSLINQLKISYDLLSSKRYEFAYVVLCQVIELINDEYLYHCNDGFWYIEDEETNEKANSWSINYFRRECKKENDYSEEDKKKFPEWKKTASLYYQLWKQTDTSFGYKVQSQISERNKFMHNESEQKSDIHSEKGYLNLFETIQEIISFI